MVEAKTIDPRARSTPPSSEHTYQVQIQLGLLREVTPHRPEFAVISYTDASFWDETTEFVVKFAIRRSSPTPSTRAAADHVGDDARPSCRRKVGSPAAASADTARLPAPAGATARRFQASATRVRIRSSSPK